MVFFITLFIRKDTVASVVDIDAVMKLLSPLKEKKRPGLIETVLA